MPLTEIHPLDPFDREYLVGPYPKTALEVGDDDSVRDSEPC
jgi:hypothetical protein